MQNYRDMKVIIKLMIKILFESRNRTTKAERNNVRQVNRKSLRVIFSPNRQMTTMMTMVMIVMISFSFHETLLQ